MSAGFARRGAARRRFRPYGGSPNREVSDRNFAFQSGASAMLAFNFLLFGRYAGKYFRILTALAAVVFENWHTHYIDHR
jgi:hypothetical protein